MTTALLITLRGNSGSGKSTVAAGLRAAYGRGIAIIPQDVVRREIVRERDLPGAINVDLIGIISKHLLDQGVHVVLEGILYASHYGRMLDSLRREHTGPTFGYYFDIPYEATVERHWTKSNCADWSPEDMRGWYREKDLLSGHDERIIGLESRAEETVQRILAETGLLDAPRPPHPGFAEVRP
ncbi:kinase [Actinospica robiniae]|uniref:kinase n=1 Tax=Actinospica robiniae TaxID=304901 RepID=UPI000428A1E0|nr:kinase [Actinospica robiniae]